MPELPEVETTRLSLNALVGQRVDNMRVLRRDLRWPVSAALPKALLGQTLVTINRRGKYLLFQMEQGTCLVHLGMSGSLRLVVPGTALRKHDHVEWQFDHNAQLRFHDPRRFGAVLWIASQALQHPLLKHLGPEPLTADFNGEHWYQVTRKLKAPIHAVLMDAKRVVGIGNIYAQEALFSVGIRPQRAAGTLSKNACYQLVDIIKAVLLRAITAGGTTLRDYTNGRGEPGYFAQVLQVYGRGGQPCRTCGQALQSHKIAQRTVAYCVKCQKYK